MEAPLEKIALRRTTDTDERSNLLLHQRHLETR